MTRNRNSHLGTLLTSERSVFYIQILYRLLLFRRDHELEPLNEDIYVAVKSAQEVASDQPYLTEQFNHDIKQLSDWQILDCRIEKERLRGYKDVRRNKFRYKLSDEALAFILWLEERLQNDLEEILADTRNLLVDVNGCLNETLRSLNRFSYSDHTEESARGILYQIYRLNDLTMNINIALGEFNARLLSFLLSNYKIDEVRGILRELELYLDSYLKKLYQLRGNIIPGLEKLASNKNQRKLQRCLDILKEERKKMPHLLRLSRKTLIPVQIPSRLLDFYQTSGTIDGLCQRINTSALKVWGKLRAHLRELERKNSRLESIKQCIAELSTLPSDRVPYAFFNQLLASVQMLSDPNYWDELEKADPPQPRRGSGRKVKKTPIYLREKNSGMEPVQSLEEARLEQLKEWIIARLATNGDMVPVSEGTYTGMNDFERIMQLAKCGLFNDGRRLKSIDYTLLVARDQVASVVIKSSKLRFNDMMLDEEYDGKRVTRSH